MKLRSWLRQPLPAPEANRRTLFTSAAAGAFIGGFLVVFQPFGAYDWDSPRKIPVLAGYGVVTFVLLLLNDYLLPRRLPRLFSEERWTVGRELVFTGYNIVSIGFANYLYNGFALGGVGNPGLQIKQLFFMILVTGLVGIFPAAGLVGYKYLRYLRRYAQPPQPMQPSPAQQSSDAATRLDLLAENGKDRLSLALADLLYLESADNYAEVVFSEKETLRKVLLRGSLSHFAGQVPPDVVLRCHRSYLVNWHRVERVSGNAQGYRLHLRGLDAPLPVARAYSDLVKRWRST